MEKCYQFVCNLPAKAAARQIESLLQEQGVEYAASDASVVSTSTPISVFGVQRAMYSRRNWVGLNPFAIVSGVDVRFRGGIGESTNVTVHVNKGRAFLIAGFFTAISIIAATAMPEPAGVILVLSVSLATWFGFVCFLGGYLLRKEIADQLSGLAEQQQ